MSYFCNLPFLICFFSWIFKHFAQLKPQSVGLRGEKTHTADLNELHFGSDSKPLSAGKSLVHTIGHQSSLLVNLSFLHRFPQMSGIFLVPLWFMS